jgi:hypothetical protein
MQNVTTPPDACIVALAVFDSITTGVATSTVTVAP